MGPQSLWELQRNLCETTEKFMGAEFLEQKQQNELIEHEKAALRSELMEERALRQRQQEEAEIDSSNLTMSSNPEIGRASCRERV